MQFKPPSQPGQWNQPESYQTNHQPFIQQLESPTDRPYTQPERYASPHPQLLPQPPRKRMRRNDKIALGFLAALLLIFASLAIGALKYYNNTSSVSTPVVDVAATATASDNLTATANTIFEETASAQITPTPLVFTPTPTPVVATWTTTHTFTGNGPKNTEIFIAPSDWKILYTCTYQDGGAVDGVISVEVYGADNNIIDIAINATCHNAHSTGETEEHQGGQVYLKMNGTGDWTVQVQELQ